MPPVCLSAGTPENDGDFGCLRCFLGKFFGREIGGGNDADDSCCSRRAMQRLAGGHRAATEEFLTRAITERFAKRVILVSPGPREVELHVIPTAAIASALDEVRL